MAIGPPRRMPEPGTLSHSQAPSSGFEHRRSIFSTLSEAGRRISSSFEALLSTYRASTGALSSTHLCDLVVECMAHRQTRTLGQILGNEAPTELWIFGCNKEPALRDPAGWQVLRDAIPTGAALRELSISDVSLDGGVAEPMFEAMKNMPNLRKLLLSNVVSEANTTLPAPGGTLALDELIVEGGNGRDHGSSFPVLMAILGKSQLCALTLETEEDTTSRTGTLMTALLDQTRLRSLCLRSTITKSGEFFQCCIAFLRDNATLHALSIEHRGRRSGAVGSTVFNAFIQAVGAHKRIASLTLQGCFNGQATKAIRLDVLAAIPSLRRLTLVGNRFDNARDILPLIDSLKDNENLQDLALVWEGPDWKLLADSLTAALKQNRTLSEIALPAPIEKTDTEMLVGALASNWLLQTWLHYDNLDLGGPTPGWLTGINARNQRFPADVAGAMMALLENAAPPGTSVDQGLARYAAMLVIRRIGHDAAGLVRLNRRAVEIADGILGFKV